MRLGLFLVSLGSALGGCAPEIDGDPCTAPNGSRIEHGQDYETPEGCAVLHCDDGLTEVKGGGFEVIDGDLEIAAQDVVDEHVCLQRVDGDLTVTGSTSSVAELLYLQGVAGSLFVADSSLTLLDFVALQEVGGDIVIADNPQLRSMSFPANMSAFGGATIENNDALPDLDGAGFFTNCQGCRAAAYQDDGAEPAEGDGDGLVQPSGGVFYGPIRIANNDILRDVSAMAQVWYAWDSVTFTGNARLDALALGLQEVQGDLEISDNEALPFYEADMVVAGADVWGETRVCGNLGGSPCN